jgi:uncharacterized protein (TIGR03118 family)
MKTIHTILPKGALALLAAVTVANFALPVRALPLQGYTTTNLVADLPGVAANLDTNLLNPWGLVFDESGDPIVADNADNLATFYGPDGTVVPFSINAGIAPSGMEFNTSTNDFKIGPSSNAQPAELLICTESGTILGFSLAVSFNTALVTVDDSASGAVYKGMTIARVFGKEYLYVTDFHNGKIKVYDSTFKYVGAFTDPHVDAGYAPFNVRNIGGFLFVTFAKQKPGAMDDQAGAGNGFVDIFLPEGILIKRLVSHGNLNSPWGLTYVPFTFGKLGGSLLVGNFGDGRINAYDPITGKFEGTLSSPTGTPITIPGLWSLKLAPHINGDGDDDCDDPLNTNLYFTAGPNGENDGILGIIQPTKH